MNRVTLGILATFVAILLVSGIFAYFLQGRSATTTVSSAPPAAEHQAKPDGGFLSGLFGPDATGLSPASFSTWEATASRIALRFSLAAFLAAILAFRPRRGFSLSHRNPYVAQTQILMAVVAGAMMMVVGDSAARAFGIFAAASLVRFRTNIRDPKETTVLLICLGVGLASGIGRWDMALILTLFVLLALSVLEYFEQHQVVRSMELSVETRNVERTNEVLMKIFGTHKFDAELRELNRQDEDDPLGKIVYMVNLSTTISTSKLSDEILSADGENVDTVEWDQKEISTYIYR